MICSDCLKNEGLKREALKVGVANSDICPKCGASTGKKLGPSEIDRLIDNFFVAGSWQLTTMTLGPIYKRGLNSTFSELTTPKFDDTLTRDIGLLQSVSDYSIIFSTPRTWDAGVTDLYFDVKNCMEETPGELNDTLRKAFDQIIDRCSEFLVTEGKRIYRIRLNLEEDITSPLSYDSAPPEKVTPTRYAHQGLPAFYGSFDIDTCIHECRTTVYDELVLATFECVDSLKLLDLEEFDWQSDMNSNVQAYLNLINESTDYEETRLLAKRIHKRGFDGIKSESYFSKVQEEKHSNLTIFGYPVKEGKLSLVSLNRIKIDVISYKYRFGPILAHWTGGPANL